MTLLRDIAKDILRLGVALLFLGAVVATAWTGPTQSPPGGNTAAPLNVGATAQTKAGELTATKLISQGDITATGKTTSVGGFVAESAVALRMAVGNYGSMWYNDGSTTYFLLTNSGDKYGSWNSLRPLYINNATGLVYINTGLCLAGSCKTTWSDVAGTYGFGGMYYYGGSSFNVNPLTGTYGCPAGYSPAYLGLVDMSDGKWLATYFCYRAN